VEPITHALASLALSRAGLNRVTRWATPLLLASGLAADLDELSLLGGARAYFNCHRRVTHSLPATALVVLAIAGVFWWRGRRGATAPIQFKRAVIVTAIGASTHLALDLADSYGIQLLWPFRPHWYAWDLLHRIDPWILIALLLGLLLPGLFRMVSEEIGGRPSERGIRGGARLSLAAIVLDCGARWVLHLRALELLNAHLYHQARPLTVGAFPSPASPLTWHGMVETENTFEEVELSLAPGSYFDPDRSRTHFKPESSSVLEAARRTPAVENFLQFARFPKAAINRLPEGFRVELRDLRFAAEASAWHSVFAVVELDSQARVTREEFRFAPPKP
jgi:inner membrane protein